MSNVITFTGNLGKDAEPKSLPSGASLLAFTVGNTVGFGDKKTTNWFNISVFGKQAEGALVDYLKKGTKVFISGELTFRQYDKSDGTQGTSLEVRANIVDLIGSRTDAEPHQEARPAPKQQQRPAHKPSPYKSSTNAPEYEDFDDSLPF